MASATFTKDTGFLSLLLLGVLLPSVLVSGLSTTLSATSVASTSVSSPLTATSVAAAPSSVATGATTTQPLTSTTIGSTAVPTTAISGGSTASTTTTTTQSSTNAASTTSGASPSTTTQSSSSTMPTIPSTSTSGSSSTVMSTNQPSNPTGATSDMTATTSMSMINCPTFTCNYSDCYMMYISRNETACEPGEYCQLMRQMDMCYTVGCVASCNDSCYNASQDNCTVNCCNFNGCLNDTFSSMMMTTTTVITATTTTTTTTTTPDTTTTATSPQTSANNGNKCRKGVCTGETCYTDFGSGPLETCPSSQPHCELKKESVNSGLQWTAGCTTNCSEETPCKESTKPPCHLECCNATITSCLWLNGTLNVPSFATRGPHMNTEMLATLFCLLALTLLL